MPATDAQRCERWLLPEIARQHGLATRRDLIRAWWEHLESGGAEVDGPRGAAAVNRGMDRLKKKGFLEAWIPRGWHKGSHAWRLTAAGELEHEERQREWVERKPCNSESGS